MEFHIYPDFFVCAPIFLIILEISDKWIGLYFSLILQSICIQNIVCGGVQGLVKYVLKKLLFMLLSLFILASATFFLMKAIPGDPFTSEKKVSPEIRVLLEQKYGLDKPMYEQYLKYMGGIIKGDFRSLDEISQSRCGRNDRRNFHCFAEAWSSLQLLSPLSWVFYWDLLLQFTIVNSLMISR